MTTLLSHANVPRDRLTAKLTNQRIAACYVTYGQMVWRQMHQSSAPEEPWVWHFYRKYLAARATTHTAFLKFYSAYPF